jgi:hypothetical protein
MGCEDNPRLSRKGIYFQKSDSSKNIPGGTYQNYKTPVKLEFTLQNLQAGKKYRIKVVLADVKNFFYTEEITSPNSGIISFNTCYICDYFFERQQYLNITILKDGITSSYSQIPLGLIVGSPKGTYNASVEYSNINITIKAMGLTDTNSFMDINLYAQNLDSDFTEIKNKISFRISGKSGNIIYQSESVNYKGGFDSIQIPLALLEPSFNIIFNDCYQKDIIYKQETPDSFVNNNPNSIYLGLISNNSRINIKNNSKIIRNFNFIDYLKSGVTIKLTIGIDFTSSNKPPEDPSSLHYLSDSMNDYELAIKACGSIVAYYDYNQSFPVYGFGAILKGGDKKPNMCFNVNFKQNPEIYTIDNVIQEYRNCFHKIYLAGPTEFCPLVQKVNETIRKENNPLKYHILMILTDGIIVDQQKTIDALVEGSFLPLSVIIIGIGNDHFQEMIQLDGDDIPLISSTGIKRMRDLVQFVPFNKYRNDPSELAAQVLEEVPRQIMEYYTMNNIFPYNLAMSQINKFGFNNMNNQNNNMNKNNFYPAPKNNYYENNDNTYVDYIQKYKNDTYKNHLNNSKFARTNSFISSNRNRNSNYHVVFDDERGSRGTGTGTATGSLFY